ncbi:uncharacterized protein MONBRDRAFT_37735 [Monosiga brevicollis MX1]|uniref:Centrosomal protein POC5 n=1 Tax=Monosiga brevicollis TaxID=81824 RepID=A9V3R1_MONBE|nr:uncharacterized protein MONBRDRAFT_37735 [Monosiga brevicollis MX1]EDQ87749.1 predicted protein [Monosiga brevicollis MX1]|eukprot:XP_001747282.1 hypothetical protein [Monosiga brevicollis MX1]
MASHTMPALWEADASRGSTPAPSQPPTDEDYQQVLEYALMTPRSSSRSTRGPIRGPHSAPRQPTAAPAPQTVAPARESFGMPANPVLGMEVTYSPPDGPASRRAHDGRRRSSVADMIRDLTQENWDAQATSDGVPDANTTSDNAMFDHATNHPDGQDVFDQSLIEEEGSEADQEGSEAYDNEEEMESHVTAEQAAPRQPSGPSNDFWRVPEHGTASTNMRSATRAYQQGSSARSSATVTVPARAHASRLEQELPPVTFASADIAHNMDTMCASVKQMVLQFSQTYNENMQGKEAVIESLTQALEKEQERRSLQHNMVQWKLQLSERKREHFTSVLARRHHARTEMIKAFRGWRSVIENKYRDRIDRACQARAEEVCMQLRQHYEARLHERRVELEALHQELQVAEMRNAAFQQDVKKAFMRGW